MLHCKTECLREIIGWPLGPIIHAANKWFLASVGLR
jgi:hypothetical protein